ncbi:hypothetical protein JCM10212_000146 [Sporobolomyces blumeae]
MASYVRPASYPTATPVNSLPVSAPPAPYRGPAPPPHFASATSSVSLAVPPAPSSSSSSGSSSTSTPALRVRDPYQDLYLLRTLRDAVQGGSHPLFRVPSKLLELPKRKPLSYERPASSAAPTLSTSTTRDPTR